MPHHYTDKYKRLQAMLLDDGGTLDLSPNDKDAIRCILGMLTLATDNLAEMNGTTYGDEFRRIGTLVDSLPDK
jgi:hypothetical protein